MKWLKNFFTPAAMSEKLGSQYARSLIEASLDPLVTISAEGKITDVNEATIKVTGVARERLICTDFSDYFTEPDKAREGYQQVFAKGFVTDYPLTIRHRDGRLTDVLYNASVYRDVQGNVLGIFAAARDITESKRLMREFEETRQFLDNILQSSTKYSIISKDLNHRILSWNEGARRNYGYTEEEIIGKKSSILHVPEDIESGAVDRLMKTAYERGLAEGEFQRIRKDGSLFLASVVVTRRNDASGSPIGYLIVSNDITEKKQAEEKLYIASKYARSLIEASLDPLVTISAEGKITDVNEATIKVTGIARERLIGTDFSNYFTEPARARQGYQQVFAKGFVTDYPLTIRHKNGCLTDVLYNASVYKDAKEKVIGVFAAARDITERKKLENQLRDVQKMEAVGQLAGGVAHDFNNILSTISGYAHLAQTDLAENDPRRCDIEQILKASERGADLTRSLLAFSRKQVTMMTAIDLNAVISGIEEYFPRLIGEDITFVTKPFAETLSVMADRGQLEQALMNLATNARDAMPNGGILSIKISSVMIDTEFIEAHGYGAEGEFAVVSIADSGVGMDERTKSRIFEPFFTTKEQGKGTGLGLSIVYGIVKSHYGFINVYSEPGKGTVFRLYFPLLHQPPEVRDEIRKPQEPAKSGTETILVGEDDEALRRLVVKVLTRQGYRVIEAGNGQEAIDRFCEFENAIDFVILDAIMPVKNGHEAYLEMKAIRPELKVILESGYSSDIFTVDDISGENTAFMGKPVSPNALLAKVREMLDKGL